MDIDSVEICKRCQEPLALIETARDVGQIIGEKKAYVTAKVAKSLNVFCFVLLYSADSEDRITGFRAQTRYPHWSEEVKFTPEQWSELLYVLHAEHEATYHADERIAA